MQFKKIQFQKNTTPQMKILSNDNVIGNSLINMI